MPGLPAFPLATPGRLARLARVIAVPLILFALLSAGAGDVVRIKRGDTLSDIARRYHTTVAALRELNDIPGNNVIYAGDTLRLPGGAVASKPAPRKIAELPRYHTVVSGDTLIELA